MYTELKPQSPTGILHGDLGSYMRAEIVSALPVDSMVATLRQMGPPERNARLPSFATPL